MRAFIAVLFGTAVFFAAHAQNSSSITDISADGKTSATYKLSSTPARPDFNKPLLEIPYGLVPDWTATPLRQVGGMAWGDYDNDGDLDLAAGCYFSNSYPPIPEYEVLIFKNENGVLSTNASWVSTDMRSTTDVHFADINGDGRADLLAANGDGSYVPSVIYMNSSGGLSNSPSWISSGTYWAVGSAFGDINGDGKLDLVLANQGNSTVPAKPILAFINNNGTLPNSPSWSSSDQMITNSVAFGDLNSSDITAASSAFTVGPAGAAFHLPMVPVYAVDSVIVNGVPTRIYCFNKTEGWVSVGGRPRAGSTVKVKYRYVNKGDIAVSKWVNYACGVYSNNSGALSTLPVWTNGNTSGRKGVVFDDFDRDGFMDVVFGGNTNQAQMYKNVNGTLTGPVWTSNSVNPSTQELISGDLDNDGYPELAAVHFGTKRIEIFKNRNGVLDTAPTWLFIAASSATAIAFGDVNGDGGLDLAVGTAREPIVVFLNQEPPVPVEFVNFTAAKEGASASLQWTTASEKNNRGFEVQRGNEAGGWQTVAFIPGNGTTTEPKTYSYRDVPPTGKLWLYRLKQMDWDGKSAFSKVLSVTFELPVNFELSQNFPNPFNPATTIRFALASDDFITIGIFDPLGHLVLEAAHGIFPAGAHSITVHSADLASGVYFYRMSGRFGSITRSMIISK